MHSVEVLRQQNSLVDGGNGGGSGTAAGPKLLQTFAILKVFGMQIIATMLNVIC